MIQDDLEEVNRKLLDVLDDLQRLFARQVDNTVKGTVNPLLQGMLKGTSIDMAGFLGMTSGQISVDPYRIIGLDRSASDEEVKGRFHQLLHKLHPDTAGVKGTDFLLQLVMMAYSLIKRERGVGVIRKTE